MSNKKTLIEITYHTDDDTGTYEVGEIDYGIKSWLLDSYLINYKYQGKNEIIRILAYLIYNIENRYRELDEIHHFSGLLCCDANENPDKPDE